jgi:hypothetical protein
VGYNVAEAKDAETLPPPDPLLTKEGELIRKNPPLRNVLN